MKPGLGGSTPETSGSGTQTAPASAGGAAGGVKSPLPRTSLKAGESEYSNSLQRVVSGGRTQLRLRGGRRSYVLRRLLACSDLLALGCSYGAMVAVRALVIDRGPLFPVELWLFAGLLPLWVALGMLLKLYHVGDRSLDYSVADEIGPVVLVATVWNWVLLLSRAVTGTGPVEVLASVSIWAASIVLVLALRVLTIWIARGSRWFHQRVLVIGSPGDIDRVVRRIDRHPEYGLNVVRTAWSAREVSDSRPLSVASLQRDEEHLHVSVSEAAELAALAEQVGADRVIVATAPESLEARSELIRDLIELGMQVDLVSGEPDLCSSNASLHYVEGLPVLTVPSVQVAQSWKALKRSIDMLTAALGLVLLAPLFAGFALGIKLGSPGPVLFRQKRIGRAGTPFELLKFRTMIDGADNQKGSVAELNIHAADETQPAMFKVPSDPRITRLGNFLRRWSLDELPQLWNVLRGEMSLVGPRPLIPEEAVLIEGRYEVRLEMRPGITGPWQTLGRSDIGFEDMIKLDYTYVMNWTLAEDFKLLIRTFGAVVYARGAY